MKYKCVKCGAEFDDGNEYAEHVAEHGDSDLGVTVDDSLIIADSFGG